MKRYKSYRTLKTKEWACYGLLDSIWDSETKLKSCFVLRKGNYYQSSKITHFSFIYCAIKWPSKDNLVGSNLGWNLTLGLLIRIYNATACVFLNTWLG